MLFIAVTDGLQAPGVAASVLEPRLMGDSGNRSTQTGFLHKLPPMLKTNTGGRFMIGLCHFAYWQIVFE